ncbi:DUF3291 domain-containing protein [Patiriisocius hiemis]|uniref:DUF3291 domain-containing protein n=1 Tax=Patiriisocius hiemis TaxID=3075604 RepID=A0ABU2YBE9_9FLAO|nr:DUF3291 domain-containing protein [Constantimarinum sp. W242]MDT0554545.1 DUF3291 domain-containing protein [Constantimarinum sp. W242]
MHIAQLNIAEAKDHMESETMKDFVANTDRINALAEAHPGFIWRLVGEDSNDSYDMELWDSPFIITNMSVWKDRESLFDYVYNTAHVEILKRKKEWFHKMPRMHMVLWYVKEGHIPTITEAKEHLQHLHTHGESEYAFTFKSKF